MLNINPWLIIKMYWIFIKYKFRCITGICSHKGKYLISKKYNEYFCYDCCRVIKRNF